MNRKEYELIKYNISEDPAKKAKYTKLKQKLVKRHIALMKSSAESSSAGSEFVSRERTVEVIVPTESDWPKNAIVLSGPEKRIPAEELKRVLEEYDRCDKQEAAIKEYIEYLTALKGGIKSKMAELAQGTGEWSLNGEAAGIMEDCVDSTTVLQKLQEALEKKAKLDEEISKECSEFMQPPA